MDMAGKPLLDVLSGQVLPVPPVWLMRQAGRYLPEYRKIREQAGSFLELCFNPDLAAEVTLQPIRRFQFDAAILFSDILVVPHALGQQVTFEAGEGPRLAPLIDTASFRTLAGQIDHGRLAPVYETIGKVKAALPPQVAFLGFCGAPWTVATYMVAGQGTPDQAPARLLAYRDPDLFEALIARLVESSAEYLVRQFAAGVDAVQIFDTWAGVLPPHAFERWCIRPTAELVARVRQQVPGARIIGFPRGAQTMLPRYAAATGVDAVGLDWMVAPEFIAERLNSTMPVQGQLDPLALVAGGSQLDEAVDRVRAGFAGRPLIFNLGHGIVPQTPIAHVEQMLARIRQG